MRDPGRSPMRRSVHICCHKCVTGRWRLLAELHRRLSLPNAGTGTPRCHEPTNAALPGRIGARATNTGRVQPHVSLSRAGDCYDAVMEAFFSTIRPSWPIASRPAAGPRCSGSITSRPFVTTAPALHDWAREFDSVCVQSTLRRARHLTDRLYVPSGGQSPRVQAAPNVIAVSG
jgi:hypothetical protein